MHLFQIELDLGFDYLRNIRSASAAHCHASQFAPNEWLYSALCRAQAVRSIPRSRSPNARIQTAWRSDHPTVDGVFDEDSACNGTWGSAYARR